MKLLWRVRCWFGMHDYYEVRRLNMWSHLMGCKNCPNLWGMNTQARALIPWTMELEEHHRFMGDI